MLTLILEAILKALAILVFHLESALGKLLDMLYGMFEVFAGTSTVQYGDGDGYLLDILFSQSVINTIYWGMALIGIVLTFAFAIAAVVKKGFDGTGEKVKATYGMILTNIFKAILLILLMTAIVSATITATGVLMTQIDYLFDNAEAIADPATISFDDEDYATMFRILDNIGNHILNPSYNNRFNINSCFNEIRADMKVLEESRVFNYSYEEEPNSWQYAIRQIYLAADINEDIPVDIYNEAVTNAILNIMNLIKTDASFKPLSEYTRSVSYENAGGNLGRTIMVASSFSAAKNNSYNKSASLTDALRGSYYNGTKDIYNLDTVEDDFDIGFGSWNHAVAVFALFILIIEFAKILINCVARIFNLMLLYVTAPGFISVMPLDDGGKLKQWTVSFIIQSLSIFGTFIAVRLMIMFVPIILNPELVLFPSSATQNILAKVVFIIGICITATKASGMISGILADNAGYQSIMAGDVGSGLVSRGMALSQRAIGFATHTGLKVAGKTLGGVATFTGLGTVKDSIGKATTNLGQSMRDKGGIIGAYRSGFTTNAQDKEKEARAMPKKKKPV